MAFGPRRLFPREDGTPVGIEELYRQSRQAAVWGVALSLVLALAKFMGGWFGHSVALLSDAVQSLGDAVVFTVVLVALIWSQRPADREHPYGHTRAEGVAGYTVALLIILSAFWVAWETLHHLGDPYQEPENYTLWIAGASAFLKETLYRYSAWVGRRTNSRAIQATAWDHRLDALSSVAVLVALALIKWQGPAWHAADHVAALGVAVVIFLGGCRLLWGSLQDLMDRQAEPDVLQAVRQEALAVPGVRGVEKLLARKTGLEYLVDIHVEVDPAMTVREGHAIAHAVKDQIITRMVPVKDVLVHIEPDPRQAR